MYTGKVYNIMIGCPSDIQEEVEIAKKVIYNRNAMNSENSHVVLLPLHWKTNSFPANGGHPQTLLNKQMVSMSDMLVCIFGSKLGTPTENAPSGSVEEIQEHEKAGKPVMIFFRQKNKDVRSKELLRLEEYKKDNGNRFLWFDYDDVPDFETLFRDKLELFLNTNWLKDNVSVKEDNGSLNLNRGQELKQLFDLYRVKKPMPDPFSVEYTNKQIQITVNRDLEILHNNLYLFHAYATNATRLRNKLDGVMAVLTNPQSSEFELNNAALQLFDLDSELQKIINSELSVFEITAR